MKRARILLADDHKLLLEACKTLLEPEFEVVGAVGDGRSLLRAAAELKPDLIVLDISMPLMNGLEAGRQLRAILPTVKLIYLTMNQDLDIVNEAFQIGATGYVVKSSAFSELRDSIRRGLLGKTYITPLVTKSMADPILQSPARRKEALRLTRRQREVLQLLAEGRTMKEAAFILHVKPRTVAFHKYRMMEDFNLRTNAELLKFALRQQFA